VLTKITIDISNIEQLEVNKFARRSRQLKNFSRKDIYRATFGKIISTARESTFGLKNIPVFKQVINLSSYIYSLKDLSLPISHGKRLLIKVSLLSVLLVASTSLTPTGTFVSTQKGYASDYLSYASAGDILVADEEGYLVKINPQTNESNRVGLTDFALHTVESGESLSIIAEKYSVSMDTIRWENNLANANSIRAGQKLLIPPVDGVSYNIESNDTIDKIAKKYEITTDALIAQNNLDTDVNLLKGNQLFLPGAKPLAPPVTINPSRTSTNTRDVRVATTDYSSVPASTSSPVVGKIFIKPTIGSVTNGYKAGHYAIDLADRSKPPIWAPAGGTVEKVSVGTWGGGYGNHIIINHGGGLKTLYAHLDSVNVSVGDYVNQGDVIGKMGNTGRVYGVTGIHLHWEVMQDGVKMNPLLYY